MLCLIKTIYRTLSSRWYWDNGFIISGHDYVEQDNGDLVCEVCGAKNKWEVK